MQVQVNAATTADLVELAGIAAATFPLACPPSAAAEAVDAFIVATLSASRFGEYLADPDRVVLTATDADRIVGYAMLIRGADTSGADTSGADTDVVQPDSALTAIAIGFSVVPAVLIAASLLLLRRYRLDEELSA